MRERHLSVLLLIGLGCGLPPVKSADSARSAGIVAGAEQGGDAGIVTGRVLNAATGSYLQGALVELAGTGLGAITERDGSFRLRDVPPGSHQIRVTYTGLDALNRSVQVAAGRTIGIGDLELTSGIYALETYVVAGVREGSALALTTQKNAPNVSNVVAGDTFGTVANGNPGDLLIYLPGVAAEYVGSGEVRTLQLRGMDASLGLVLMDGTKLAESQSAGTGRQFEFQGASLANVESVEVNKALTPDMEADSISGSINFKSKSAFERGERRVIFNAGATFTPKNDIFPDYSPWGWSASAEYSDILGAQKRIAVILGTTYYLGSNPTDSVQPRFQNTTTSPAYIYQLVAPRPAPGPTRKQTNSLKLEYKWSDRTQYYFGLFFNRYRETSNPRIFQLTTAQSVATLNAQGQPTGNGAILPNYTELMSEARQLAGTRADVTVRWFPKDGKNYRFNPGARHRFDAFDLDWNVSYSYADTYYDWWQTAARLTNIGWRIERDGPESTAFHYAQTAGPDMYNLANYTSIPFAVTRRGPWNGYSDILAGQVDLTKAFRGRHPFTIKSGLKYRAEQRDVERTDHVYTYTGSQGLNRFLDPEWSGTPQINGYRTPPWIGVKQVQQALQSSPNEFTENPATTLQSGFLNDKEAREEVSAAYLMGHFTVGRLKLLGGARGERTELDAAGPKQEITPAERTRRAAWVGAVTQEESIRRTIAEYGNRQTGHATYSDVFPSLHARYNLTRNFVARASWATGIGRPAFSDIIPTVNVNHDTDQVVATNPALKPQHSTNYDLSLEYYFESVGVLSAGYFYKDISDFIFADTRLIAAGSANGFDGEYEGYALSTSSNGGSAEVEGFEINYSQQLTALPGVLKYFGVLANYTRIRTKGDYGTTQERSTGEIAGFIPRSGNAGISFVRGRVDIRLLWNFTGKYLAAYSTSPALLQYNAPRDLYTIKTKWRIGRNYWLYVDARNITNTPGQNQYTYIPSRLFNWNRGSPSYYFGMGARF